MNDEQFRRARIILDFVWNNQYSDFYRRKFEKAGFDPEKDLTAPQDFKKIPMLTKDELVSTHPDDRLFWPKGGFWNVTSTSGTSSQKPAFFYSKQSSFLDRTMKLSSPIGSTKKVLLFNLPSRIPGVYNKILDQDVLLLVGDLNNLAGTAYQASYLGIDGISASLSLLIVFSDLLKKCDYDPSNIKFLRCTGELATDSKLNLLKQIYPNAKIELSYGSEEAGRLGFCCDHIVENNLIEYHSLVDYFYELHDDELVVTLLRKSSRFATPLIRYRTGDVAIFLDKSCPCGLKLPLFSLGGRAGFDYVKVNGGFFSEESLSKAISIVGGDVEDYLLHISEKIYEGRLQAKLLLEVVPREGAQISPLVVSESISENMPVGNKTLLKDAVAKGLFSPIEILIVKNIARSGHKTYHLKYSSAA